LKEKVFSPFCTTKPRGMGLGLPIVKRTVFDHNGRVDIESNPQGTAVSVMLPATAK
jgi:nitrogen-specific signal transduction histidine kinase